MRWVWSRPYLSMAFIWNVCTTMAKSQFLGSKGGFVFPHHVPITVARGSTTVGCACICHSANAFRRGKVSLLKNACTFMRIQASSWSPVPTRILHKHMCHQHYHVQQSPTSSIKYSVMVSPPLHSPSDQALYMYGHTVLPIATKFRWSRPAYLC